MLTAKPRFPVAEILLYGFLPSLLKKAIYRLKGYRIGRGVSLGFGSVVCGQDVELGDHVTLGFFTIVRARQIKLGPYVQVGSASILDAPHIEIGEGTKINEQVFVGGLDFPDSKLIVGRNCQIMQMTFINPTRTIRIGDDTGIGGDCLLFGHSSWLSKFEGYPVEFDSIEIGNSVSLAWRVFVLPGAKIGDGAVIGANSLVRGTIPPRSMAIGFPARVVAQSPDFPRPVGDLEKGEILRDIVVEMLQFLEDSGLACRREGECIDVTQTRRRWGLTRRRSWRLWVAYDALTSIGVPEIPADIHVVLSLREIPAALRAALRQRGTVWIDVQRKERATLENDLAEEVVQYLRRYGVRFLRVT